MQEREVDRFYDRAIKIAKRAKSFHPLKLGDTVVHPDDPRAYELKSVEGAIAHVGFVEVTGETVEKDYLLHDLLDVNLLHHIAIRLVRKEFDRSRRN